MNNSFLLPSNGKIDRFDGHTISATILKIGAETKYVDAYEFCTLINVSEVVVDPQNKWFAVMDGILYSKDLSSLIWYPPRLFNTTFEFQLSPIQTIKRYAFAGNSNISDVILNDYVQTIENGAFLNSSITSFTGGFGLKTIGMGAFGDCKRLKIVVFQDGLTDIQTGAFNNCRNLQEIHIPKSVTHIGYDRSFSTFSKKTTIYCSDRTVASEFAKNHGFNYRIT